MDWDSLVLFGGLGIVIAAVATFVRYVASPVRNRSYVVELSAVVAVVGYLVMCWGTTLVNHTPKPTPRERLETSSMNYCQTHPTLAPNRKVKLTDDQGNQLIFTCPQPSATPRTM